MATFGNGSSSAHTHDLPIPRGALATPAQCQELWHALTEHRMTILSTSFSEERTCLVLRANQALAAQPRLSARDLRVLEGMLLGVERKVISFDLGIATSTVAQILKQALVDMGLSCSPARVPPLLVMLVHAARGAISARLSIARFERDGQALVALSGEVGGDAWLALAPAERAVLRQRLFGKSHADIANLRRTSRRTIANQVAAATRRLGVSGRFDLLRFMALTS